MRNPRFFLIACRLVAGIGAFSIVVGTGLFFEHRLAIRHRQTHQPFFVSLIEAPRAVLKGEQQTHTPSPMVKSQLVSKITPMVKSKLASKITSVSKARLTSHVLASVSTDINPLALSTGKHVKKIASVKQGLVHVTMANYVVKPRPIIPRVSKQRGEKGRIVVRVVINAQGMAKTVSLKSPSPYPALNTEALRAVKNARFRPYSENAVPKESIADIPIEFK